MLPSETDLESADIYTYDASGFMSLASSSVEKLNENILDQHNLQANVFWDPILPEEEPSMCQVPQYAANEYCRQQTDVSTYVFCFQ